MATAPSWLPTKKPQATDPNADLPPEVRAALGLPPSDGGAPQSSLTQPAFPQAAAPENLGAQARGALPPAPAVPTKPQPVQRKMRPITSPALAPTPQAAPDPAAEAKSKQMMGLTQADPLARGGGQFNKESVSDDAKKAVVDRTAKMLPGADVQDAFATIRGTPEFKDLTQSEAAMPDVLKLLNSQPNQIDLSPLATLASQWSKGAYKPDYTPPVTQDARNKETLSALLKNQDDKRDIVKSMLTGLTAQKTPGFLQMISSDDLKRAADTGAKSQNIPRPAGGAGKPYDPTKDVKELQHAMEHPAAVQADLSNLQASIERAIGMPLSQWDGKQAIPGLGMLDRTKAAISPSLLGPDASAIRDGYNSLINDLNHAQFGSRLTQTEINNMNRSLGNGMLTSPQAMISGLNNANKTLKAIIQQREAMKAGLPHGQQIMDAYRKKGAMGEGGGVTSDTMPDTLWSGPPKAGAVTRTKKLEDMTPAELDAYEASLKGK